MFNEDIGNFADGRTVEEKDIATVIGTTDNAVIFMDDLENLYFLNIADPSAFETGTVEQKSVLMPLANADEQLKKKILEVVKEG
jgi:hypothetical protein